MVDRLNEVLAVYEQIRAEVEPYTVQVLDKEIEVLPNVFSPKYFTDSEYFAEAVPKLVQSHEDFLEIGTGTGVVSSFVNAKNIVATDINEDAVENARRNFERLGVNAEARHGHLFAPVTGMKFDVCFWNHPFNCVQEEVNDILLRGGLDYQYQDLDEYFHEGCNHLKSNGRLLLGTGNIARIYLIEELAKKHGYEFTVVAQQDCSQEYGEQEETETYYVYECRPKNIA